MRRFFGPISPAVRLGPMRRERSQRSLIADLAQKRRNEWQMCSWGPGRKESPKEVPSPVMSSRITPIMLETFNTQKEAIDWATKNGHTPRVARVRHLNDKKKLDHWRAV
jgi:hypothetical protein